MGLGRAEGWSYGAEGEGDGALWAEPEAGLCAGVQA